MHKLRTGHLFAGAGGGILADLLLGHQPIFAVEIEDYPRKVLEQRQADGVLPFFPTFGDIREFDGTPWRGTVDVLCGGFPCQDISAAGKGAGITGERSGLWKEYARLIGEMRPRFVFAENSPLLRTRGLGVVLEDLAAMGYNARWGIIGARDVGAPHKRDRMWVFAYTTSVGLQRWGMASKQPTITNVFAEVFPTRKVCEEDSKKLKAKSYILGKSHGLANVMDRLKAIGNGQVPQCAAMAFSILSEGLI